MTDAQEEDGDLRGAGIAEALLRLHVVPLNAKERQTVRLDVQVAESHPVSVQFRVAYGVGGLAGLERPDSGVGEDGGYRRSDLPRSCSGEQKAVMALSVAAKLTGKSDLISTLCESPSTEGAYLGMTQFVDRDDSRPLRCHRRAMKLRLSDFLDRQAWSAAAALPSIRDAPR